MHCVASNEDPERNKRSKAMKRTNKQRGKTTDARMFLDDAAVEDSDEDETVRDAEAVRYDAKDLERQNRFDLNAFEARLQK